MEIKLGFAQVLTIVFIVLKIAGLVSWSWIIVLSPTILEILITAIILLIAFIIYKKEQ